MYVIKAYTGISLVIAGRFICTCFCIPICICMFTCTQSCIWIFSCGRICISQCGPFFPMYLVSWLHIYLCLCFIHSSSVSLLPMYMSIHMCFTRYLAFRFLLLLTCIFLFILNLYSYMYVKLRVCIFTYVLLRLIFYMDVFLHCMYACC